MIRVVAEDARVGAAGQEPGSELDEPSRLLLAVKQAALLGAHGLAELGGELAHQLFLARRELLGDVDLELQDMVAAPALADPRDALAAAHDDLVGVDPRLELDGRRAGAALL